MTEKFVSSTLKEKDPTFEQPLRPASFDQFIGQEKIKERLKIVIQAARERGEPMEHMLFFGPPGLGKTTLAYIIAAEREAGIKTTSGPAIEKPAELAGILTNLNEGDVLFIDEIHRLSRVVEEYLYPAMEEFKIDIMIDQGPSARSVRLNLPSFTLVGATTRFGLLSSPLRSRFGIANRLDYYDTRSLKEIVLRSAEILGVEVDLKGAEEIAGRSRGTPRIANSLLRRVRDYAQVKADNRIVAEIAHKALSLLEVDEKGLDEMDKRILKTIIENFAGGPVGIETIAVAVCEEPETISEVYEPYLIQQGYLRRTRSGRCATELAYRHLKITPPRPDSAGLFNK